ncbi:MAG: hypothetical protein LBT02_04045 [Rickettsiales bacterium]|jgi:hypothetical protein|nr:hypothetical protein [Rickettsiales bacterium]
MQDKPMLILCLVLIGIIMVYFWLFGFSINKWTRYGQYGGLTLAAFFLLDNLFRPGK